MSARSAFAARALRVRRPKVLQDRQRERGGLAGAGLRDAEKIAPRQQRRNGLRLDRRRRAIILCRKGAAQGLGKAEVGE